MNRPLRQSTASQKFYFVMIDSSDFKTRKTGLTIANTDVKLIFHGGTTQTSKNSGGATEIGSTGVYYTTFDATDSATLGELRIDISVSGALPYFCDTSVINTALWDSLYSTGGAIPNVASGSAGALLVDGTGTAAISNSSGKVLLQSGTATGQVAITAGQLQVQSGTSSGQINLSNGNVGLQSGTNANQISLSGGAVTVGTNNDKTGYTASTVSDKTGYALTSAYDPAKTAAQAGDTMKLSSGTAAGQIVLTNGQVTVGTNNDKTGYTASTVSDKTGYTISSGTGTGQIALTAGQVQVQSGTASGQISITAGVVQADAAMISASSSSADNLQTMLDGSGGQTLSLGRLVISNTSGDAVTIQASGSSNRAVVLATQTGDVLVMTSNSTNYAEIRLTGDLFYVGTNQVRLTNISTIPSLLLSADFTNMTSGTGTNRAYSAVALANAPIDGTGSNVTALINMTTGTGTNRAYTSAALANAPIDGTGSNVTSLINMTTGTGTNRAYTTTALANAPGAGSAPTAVQIRQEIDANSTQLALIVSEISNVGGVPGPGADHVTLRFKLNGTTPIADADVWISTDADGTNVVAGTLQTNSIGEVTFLLDAGVTYHAWLQKDGVAPVLGDSFVAVAD